MNDKIRQEFRSPSSEYRTAPFWSWNGVMNEKDIEFQLKDMKAHGIGGAFAHPRMGMITEYLSEDYFDAWGKALEIAKREGMKLYLYDENAWPSAYAGGLVQEKDSSTIGRLAKFRITPAKDPSVGGPVIRAYQILGQDGDVLHLGDEVTDIPVKEWKDHYDCDIFAIYERYPFEGPRSYTDVTNPRTTELFLQVTYDEYYKRFGEEFGKTIPASFSDEANIHSEGQNTLPFSEHFLAKFRELHGYDVEPYIIVAFRNVTGIDTPYPQEKIRYDYYVTLHELWIDNFVKPIAKWCEDHGIAWTGHDCEHQWPQAHGGRISPSEMTTYEFRQWPGLDLLLCDDLKDTPNNFDKFLMYEIRSAANQFDKKRTLCEACGAGGYHSTVYDYKRLCDFLMAGGINFICQHLSLYSYVGVRKRDCPQSFDYRQPWWDQYTEIAEYFARSSYILSSGKMEQRILLLNPSTSTYTMPGEETKGMIDHATDVHCIENPDMSDFLTVINELTDNAWDFDLGDEYSISRHGSVDGKKFRVGSQAYDIVIVSKNMSNIKKTTADLLSSFIRAGGTVVATGDRDTGIIRYVDGVLGTDISAELTSSMNVIDGAEKIHGFVSERLDKYLVCDRWPLGVQHIRRKLDDGREVYFIVNHAMETFVQDIGFRTGNVSEWDLYDGSTRNIGETKDGITTVHVELERCGTILLVTNDKSEEETVSYKADIKVPLTDAGINMTAVNTMTLDHVVLSCDGEKFGPIYYLDATDKLFRRRDFHGNPWYGVQYRTTLVDADKNYGEGSGLSADYSFLIGKDVLPRRIIAAIEKPEVFNVAINGTPIKPFGRDGFDPDIADYDLTDYLKEGENVITLSRDVFSVHCELEAIILKGDFSVGISGDRFIMEKPQSPAYGDWSTFGYRFYSGAAEYSYTAELDRDPASAVIRVPLGESTAVSVAVNGKEAGLVGKHGGNWLDIGQYMNKGRNDITVRVAGSLRNLYGPHINYSIYIPYDWSPYDRDKFTPAGEYFFSHYGLDKAPDLYISEETK